MSPLSLSAPTVPRSGAVIALATLAGIAAACWFLARSRKPSHGIDPLRDRWDGEGPQPVDADNVVPS